MKFLNKITLSLVITVSLVFNIYSQELDYNRSSLHMILIETNDFPNKKAVMSSWSNYPFPDKYNEHDIEINNFNPNAITITEEEMKNAGIVDASEMGLPSTGMFSLEDQILPLQINKYIKENKIAARLIKEWFDDGEGNWSTDIIAKRGIYNASELDKSAIQSAARGESILADAGEQLIQNTFIVFNKLEFVSNEVIALPAKEFALEKAKQIPNELLRTTAIEAAEAAYLKAREGYSVWTKSWLYQLVWSDEILYDIYNNYWGKDFDELLMSDSFELKLLGRESASSLVLFSLKEQRSEEQIIDLATVRNIDNTYSKLQKKYDQFKPVISVKSINPVVADIGLKEGVTKKDKYDVFEIVYDPVTKKTVYKKVTTIKVDKDKIWDNRYSLDGNTSKLLGTHFKKGKNVEPGMILKLVK